MYQGKALYQPGGPAAEYGTWAINLYKGCSGGCAYCYLKRPPLSSEMGGDTEILKKCFRDEADAVETACREVIKHRAEIIRDGGVFLSFSTDPLALTTYSATLRIAEFCSRNIIPCQILTKKVDWLEREDTKAFLALTDARKRVSFGFSLTGHDEYELGSATNEERIAAMKRLSEMGFKIFASVEPVIDFPSSLDMIRKALPYCDHFMIGFLSGSLNGLKPLYAVNDTVDFINAVRRLVMGTEKTVYWKASVRKVIGGGSPIGYNFVDDNFKTHAVCDE